MSKGFPKLTAAATTRFTASHALPDIGVEKPHYHTWTIKAGYTHEMHPEKGCTFPMQQMRKQLQDIVDQLDGQHLNDILLFPPTSENIACWILVRLPNYWEFVQVEAYDGFEVTITQAGLREYGRDVYKP
mgnify:CR=1 FL=1